MTKHPKRVSEKSHEETDKYTHYIANGNGMGWGKATTLNQAVANMRRFSAVKPTQYVVYKCTKDTEVDGMGSIVWSALDPPPIRIRKIVNGKNVQTSAVIVEVPVID